MEKTPLGIPDVLVFTPRVFRDRRGLFLETWNAATYESQGLPGPWVQDNLSVSKRHVIRALHCQVRRVQGKLVRCVAGSVFDVAVDLRPSSPTLGKWCGSVLDDVKHQSLWIPPGFAHGFMALSDDAVLNYKVTDYYSPADERCLRWDDPTVGVHWPLPAGSTPILSDKDLLGEPLEVAKEWFK